jgi:hypothetical protein
MSEHEVGETVLKDVKVQNESGKQEAVIDVARGIWGDAAPVAPAAHVQQLDRSNQSDGSHQADRIQHSDRTRHGHEHDRNLAELSHQIKLLNNKLHEAGGPLHGSNMELVGFDKSGKLLMIDREHGKVAHKYLVDSESGKVVRRTEEGDPNKWESSGLKHDQSGRKQHEGAPASDASDTRSGAHLSRDAHGRVCEIEDGYGDKRVYNRDKSGHVNEVSLTINGKVEHYKLGEEVAGVTHAFWYKQSHNPGDKGPGVQISIDDATNSLKISTKATEYVIYGADGSITEKPAADREKLTRPAFKPSLNRAVDTLPKDAPQAHLA